MERVTWVLTMKINQVPRQKSNSIKFLKWLFLFLLFCWRSKIRIHDPKTLCWENSSQTSYPIVRELQHVWVCSSSQTSYQLRVWMIICWVIDDCMIFKCLQNCYDYPKKQSRRHDGDLDVNKVTLFIRLSQFKHKSEETIDFTEGYHSTAQLTCIVVCIIK
jgi:hypothetical protein